MNVGITKLKHCKNCKDNHEHDVSISGYATMKSHPCDLSDCPCLKYEPID